MTESVPLVFDTGPLRHFATQGWLKVLRFVVQTRSVYIPDSVEAELKAAEYSLPELRDVRGADWIKVIRSDEVDVLTAFSTYHARLVVGTKNLGECGVLAICKAKGFEAVMDDAVARQIADEDGIRYTTTLGLLTEAIRNDQLTVQMVEHIADDLMMGDYRLPFPQGGYRRWALEQGLIEVEDCY